MTDENKTIEKKDPVKKTEIKEQQVTPKTNIKPQPTKTTVTPQPAKITIKPSSPVKTKKEETESVLLFGKYDPSEVRINDPSLMKYVSLDTKKIPHTFGKNTRKRFAKGDLNIVERLINKLMRSGQGKRKLSGKYIRGRYGCGKKFQTMQIVEDAFELIEIRTQKNPIQILVDAIQNAGPREDTTRIKKGGVSYSVSVDVAPLKKVDEALKNLALATFSGSFKKKESAAEALAKELIATANEDNSSFSVKRRDEVERIAKASR